MAEAMIHGCLGAITEALHEAPIDPHQLLKALSPLLSKAGAIKSPVEAKRIISLMRDATKLVCRCVYVNILKVTESAEVLEMLMEGGMWDILNNWLQEATEADNSPFLTELLKVYKQLPVTVEVMKQNNAAKTIKQLSKSKDETLKTLATSIVDTWMKKIREKSNSDSTNNNGDAKNLKKKKKHSHHHKGDKAEDSKSSDNKQKSDGDAKDKKSNSHSNHSHHHHHHHHHSRLQSDGSVEMNDVKVEASNNKGDNSEKNKSDGKSDSSEVRKRARTVKVQPQRFRSTGLEEPSLPPPKRKNTSDLSNKSLPPKRASMEKPDRSSEPPEKKNRPHLNTSLMSSLGTSSTQSTVTASLTTTTTMSPTEIHEKIKIIPPKPLSTPSTTATAKHKVMDSSGFMDALISGPTTPAFRRKKKLPSVSTGNKITTTTGPVTPTTPTTPMSPNSVIAQKLPSVPSFYKDTLETSELSKEAEKPNSRSPSPTDDKDQSTVEASEDVNGADPTDKTQEEPKSGESKDGEAGEGSDVSAKSSDGLIKRKKKKKKVTWAEDHRIRQIFYFELDETERENVNKPKDFNAMKKQEMMMDRKTIETAKRLSHDNMMEAMPWHRPIRIAGLQNLADVTSSEKAIQEQREQGVLQALFFSKEMLPDGPAEADVETVERTEPALIPLDDEKSGGEEYSYTYDDVAPPQEGSVDLSTLLSQTSGMVIPPEVAGLLSSLQQAGHTGLQDNPQAISNIQNFLSNVLNNPQQDETTEQLRRLLEPLQHQVGMVPPPMSMEGGMPPAGGPPMGGPQMRPPPGLLGMAPPGFRPMGMRPPPPHGGPRPRFPGPPRVPGPRPGPGPGPIPGREDDWGENMRGGPPIGPMRPRGRAGFPVMRGRGGMPPAGRGGMMGRGGRAPRDRAICRHFAAGGCHRDTACGFYHPGVNGPPL